MIEKAGSFAGGDPRQAEYRVNENPNFQFVPSGSIDFVYSHIVLQHISQRFQLAYNAEFLRVLAPAGVAAFQVITGWHARTPSREARESILAPWVRAMRNTFGRQQIRMEMHPTPATKVAALCEAAGCRVLQFPYTNSSDPDHEGKVQFMDSAARAGSYQIG